MFAASKTASVSGGYQISRSLRFNAPDTTYLIRTPASGGNRTQWSWSMWFKIATVGTEIHLFGASQDHCYIQPNSTLIFKYGPTVYRTTSQVLRDVGAWMHLVVVWDSPNATASDRLRFYINGVQVTAFSTNNTVTQNDLSGINSVTAHNIGRFYGGSDYFNGYITEVNFIDGQALTASSFGETNAQTGVWQPKAYSGSYGTNGFYLNFSDNSNTTAATLGKDYSGNGNNWTPNNFSVTAGAGNDSLVDSPTSYGTDTGVGGQVRGNYATMNPLQKSSNVTLTNGNLDSAVGSSDGKVLATIGMSSGKWYAETSNFAGLPTVGLATGASSLSVFTGGDVYSWGYYPSGTKYTNGSSSAYGASWTTTDTIGIAFDADAGTLTFYKNGTSQGTAFSSLTSGPYFFSNGNNSSTSCSWNFGQRPFAYTAPSGFKALCTQNLPTPTIGATTATQAGKYFNPVLYTGNGTTNNISGVGFETNFVWMKNRTTARNHYLMDSVRGITNKVLESNTTTAEQTATIINSTNSDGYQLSAGDGGSNTNGDNYVAWNWKANGTGSTNTSGSITSTVSANTTSGFSVVTYTGNGNNSTVGHGLGIAPSMVIIKSRSAVQVWVVGHSAIGFGNYLLLNTTDASASGANVFNSTAPTSTVFSLGVGAGANTASATYVAYCFAEVAGYSKFGSYTGNGSSTDGPFVYTGFRPAYVMIKRTEGTSVDWVWWVMDNKRGPYNATAGLLKPNSADTENSSALVDFVSNGFKLRNGSGSANNNGINYIYAAFAESPFKYSLAR